MTTATLKLIQECERRGLQLEPRGDMLFFGLEENTTPELVAQLRRRKFEIIGILEARQRAACLHLSKQILLGEFDGCERGVRIRLMNALNHFSHPLGLRAFTRLFMDDMKEVGQ